MSGSPVHAEPTPGKIYAEYDKIIERVERWVEAAAPVVGGCEAAHVRARIVQRVVQITSDEFTRQVLDNIRRAVPPFETCHADGVTVSPVTGRVSVGFKQCMRNLFYFTASWLDVFFKLLVGCVSRAPDRSSSATILMEAGGGYEECDARLVRFFRDGPIAPLRGPQPLIVRTRTPPRRAVPSHVHYTAWPFVFLANTFLRRSARCALLIAHLKAPWIYLRAIAASPLNVLLGHDLSMLPVVHWLDRARLIDSIVLTTSAFASQPLWAKGRAGQRLKLHMIWYSQNCIPKMYQGDAERPNLPAMRHMRMDVHWVWTEGFRSYFRELGCGCEINIVGPILWYLPEPIESLGEADLKVAVFDVTPWPDGKTAFGASKNYYSSGLMRAFVGDIVAFCEDIAARTGQEVLVAIKHKRGLNLTYHDSSYLQWLDDLVAGSPHVRLVDHQTNLFGLLKECDLSVSVPYTSTAYVGAAVAKPAIYYDPPAELVPVYERDAFVHFASGPDQLKEAMMRCLDVVGAVGARSRLTG